MTPGGVAVCLWVIYEILFYGHYPDIQLAPDEGAQRDSPHLTPPRNEDSRRKFPPPPTSQRLLRLTVTVFNFYASWLPFFESVLRFTVNSNETLLVGKLCCRRILNLLSKVFSATIFSIPFSSGLRLVKDVL